MDETHARVHRRRLFSEELLIHDDEEEHDDFEDDAEAWLDNRLKSVDDRSIFSIYFYSLFV